MQDENRRTFNLRRRAPLKYKKNTLVAIKRTQFGPGLKLKAKFLGPYRIVRVKRNDTYDVEKEGFHEGPSCTSTCAEMMKPWAGEQPSSEADEIRMAECGISYGTIAYSSLRRNRRTLLRDMELIRDDESDQTFH